MRLRNDPRAVRRESDMALDFVRKAMYGEGAFSGAMSHFLANLKAGRDLLHIQRAPFTMATSAPRTGDGWPLTIVVLGFSPEGAVSVRRLREALVRPTR